jgi:puromycin-sensitive aminopeptidase
VLRVRPPRGKDRIVRALLEKKRDRIPLGPSADVAWVYANADESSFVRALHDGDILRALGGELARLAPAERMGLLGHQWAGVRADRAPLGDWLDLMTRLGDEPEPDVLLAISAPLAWMVDQALPSLAAEHAARFRARIAEVFSPALAKLGWSPAKQESDAQRQRRAALVGMLGTLAEAPEVLAEVEARIGPYLKDRRALEPNLAGPVVDLAARNGDAARFDVYLRTMEAARTPQERTRFELALGAFRAPELYERALELTLSERVPTQEVVQLLSRLLANPQARERAWEFIRERWNQLAPRISPGLASRLVSALPALQKPLYRRQVASFFASHPLPTAARTLKQALERFDLDADLRARLVPDLRSYLRGD